MRKKLFFISSFILLSLASLCQTKFYTKSGKVEFYSVTSLEDLSARNKTAVCILDTKAGSIQFVVLMKGFEFENEEMQDHFNEHYLESDKFPKSEFKGQVTNNASIQYSKPGNYTAQVKGQMSIHGVSREIQAPGVISVTADGIKVSAAFNIQVADYNIRIPSLVKDKIAKSVKIVVDAKLDPLKG